MFLFVWILGNENDSTFDNGIGHAAYFAVVHDVTQYKDGAEIIVADSNNYCIRRVNRENREVSTFAGQCSEPLLGEWKGTMPATQARLTRPVASLYMKKTNVFYYVLAGPASIVKHDILSGKPTLPGLICGSASKILDSFF